MAVGQQMILRYIRAKFRLLSSISKRKAALSAFELFCTPQHRNRKKLPPVFAQSENLSFPFGKYTVNGYRWNHPSAKKVLILHGFESSVVNFDQYIKPLVKKGYEVLAFDAPAHGRSTGKKINVLDYMGMIRHVCTRYGPIQAFIAHSFGGLCLSLALEELPHSHETKVVLIAPAVETSTAIDNFFALLHLDGEVRLEFEKRILDLGGKPPEWYSIARAAPHLKARVLFLQDKEDHMTPFRDVEPLMKGNYPLFRFVITEGLGHRRIYRDSKISGEIMEFL
jgi:pimeloyl-ACP methyl ester carboxylesterase